MFSSFCVFKVNLPPKNTTTYSEWGDGFKSVFTALCEACHFQIQPRHETCLRKKKICLSLSSKASDKPNPKTCFYYSASLHDWHVVHNTSVFPDSCFLLVLILLLMLSFLVLFGNLHLFSKAFKGQTAFFVLGTFCVVQKTSVRRLNLRMSCELLCCSVLLGIKPQYLFILLKPTQISQQWSSVLSLSRFL